MHFEDLSWQRKVGELSYALKRPESVQEELDKPYPLKTLGNCTGVRSMLFVFASDGCYSLGVRLVLSLFKSRTLDKRGLFGC